MYQLRTHKLRGPLFFYSLKIRSTLTLVNQAIIKSQTCKAQSVVLECLKELAWRK